MQDQKLSTRREEEREGERKIKSKELINHEEHEEEQYLNSKHRHCGERRNLVLEIPAFAGMT